MAAKDKPAQDQAAQAGTPPEEAAKPEDAAKAAAPEDTTDQDTAAADGDGHQETGDKTVITTPLPQQLQVTSTRRIVIELNIAEYEAESIVQAVGEMAGYVDYHSEGGYRSDPTMLFRIVDAIRAELERPGWEIPAPGLGEFLTTDGLSADEEGDPDSDAVDMLQMATGVAAPQAAPEDAGEPPQGS